MGERAEILGSGCSTRPRHGTARVEGHGSEEIIVLNRILSALVRCAHYHEG